MDEERLIHTLDTADACIHFPSEEAFGLVVAESVARGLKLFAANVGGIPDILDGVDGAELHPDFPSLEKGIARWLEAGAPSPANALETMISRYHPQVIGRRHLEIYRETLAN